MIFDDFLVLIMMFYCWTYKEQQLLFTNIENLIIILRGEYEVSNSIV